MNGWAGVELRDSKNLEISNTPLLCLQVRLLGDVSQSDQGQGKEEPSKLRGFFKDISIKRL